MWLSVMVGEFGLIVDVFDFVVMVWEGYSVFVYFFEFGVVWLCDVGLVVV